MVSTTSTKVRNTMSKETASNKSSPSGRRLLNSACRSHQLMLETIIKKFLESRARENLRHVSIPAALRRNSRLPAGAPLGSKTLLKFKRESTGLVFNLELEGSRKKSLKKRLWA